MAVDPVAGTPASQVTGAIRQAAQSTGISFQYLLTTAKIESSLNPSAQASTSSAKGLYQFIEQTWLGTLKQDGAGLGYGQYADAISKSANGTYRVEDPAAHAAIMKLRGDPTASAMMAGALARNNAFQMTGMIGRRPTEGELYAAHFLGSDGAGKLINAVNARPDANAAKMFPSAAGANHNIFYDKNGSARSVSEVYAKLTARFDNNATTAVAALPAAPAVAAVAATTRPPTATETESPFEAPASIAAAVPDTAGVTQVLAAASERAPSRADAAPLFQAMFTDRGGDAVAPKIANLWAPGANRSGAMPDTGASQNGANGQNPNPPAPVALNADPQPVRQDTAARVSANVLAAAYRPTSLLNLFTDSDTDVRGMFGRG